MYSDSLYLSHVHVHTYTPTHSHPHLLTLKHTHTQVKQAYEITSLRGGKFISLTDVFFLMRRNKVHSSKLGISLYEAAKHLLD